MARPPKEQLQMPELRVVNPFNIDHRANYGITDEIVNLFEGNEDVLMSASYGLESSEIFKLNRQASHIRDMGMTEAEFIAHYAGIGIIKTDEQERIKINAIPIANLEQAVSAVVGIGWKMAIDVFRQVNALTGDHGYNVNPNGLMKRMEFLFRENPNMASDFTASALSSIQYKDDLPRIRNLKGTPGLPDRFLKDVAGKYDQSRQETRAQPGL